ncbi:MAG: class I SAM-dependent methyltransferase [Anaerolineae bacterium]|jgi:SAM-dependent methyltransferase
MALSLDRQERYRRRYAAMRSDWKPASHVYRDLVGASLFPGARVLDLGCGRGGVVEQLQGSDALMTGVDPDLRSLRENRAPNLALTCGFAEALSYHNAVFDLVCSSWVLEHLRRPGRLLAEVARVLGPEGRFVFLTPNVRHPLLRLNKGLRWTQGELVDRLYGREWDDIFPTFYRANSPGRIEHLAREAGFESVSIRCVDDPTYLAFNELLFRIACLLGRLTPGPMRVHLVGVCAAT